MCRTHLTAILRAGDVERPEDTAELLIEALGPLPEVLAAHPSAIRRTARDERAIAAIASFRAAMTHVLRMRLAERAVLPNSGSLRDYLVATMRGETAEVVRVLYLTGNNHLIHDEVLVRGTLDQAPIYAREVVHRALDLGAANLVLAHNHPSGDELPSNADIRMTRRLIEIANGLNLCVLDHLIVGRTAVTSMRAEGLIGTGTWRAQ